MYRTIFNNLNKRNQKAIAKRFSNRKMRMWKFMFRLPNLKILDKKVIFSVKNKQKGKYVKK